MESPVLKMKRRRDVAHQNFFNKQTQQGGKPFEQVQDSTQFQDMLEQCSVCRTDLGAKRKQWYNCSQFSGVCKFSTCSQHLRKKRRDKNGVWARVCDDCEDKYLFECYMKYELKAEDAIAMQEEIVTAKKRDVFDQVKGKESMVLVLNNQLEESKQKHQQLTKKVMVTHNDMERKHALLQTQQKQASSLEEKLNVLEKSLPRPLEDDFGALKIQNEKITKELVKLEKRVNQAIQAISQKEKDINSAYHKWQNTQKEKKQVDEDKCKVS